MWVAALLVLLAGVPKVLRPAPTRQALHRAGLPSAGLLVRAVGLAEIGVAGLVLLRGGATAAAGLAVLYLGFAAFLLRLRDRAGAGASCSCLGGASTPATIPHILVNVLVALVAIAAALAPIGPAWTLLASTPWAGIPAVGLLALAVALVRALFSDLPAVLQAARLLTDAKETA